MLTAYNGGRIVNLGQIELDLRLDSGDILRNQSFIVSSSNQTPLLGANILLPDNQELVIDKKAENVVIQGMQVALFGRVPVGENELSVGSVLVSTSDQPQTFTAKTNFVIPAKSTAMIPAKMKLLPSGTNFLVEDQVIHRFIKGQRFILPIARALYGSEQYDYFRIKVVNSSNSEIQILEGSKLGKIVPVCGEDVPEFESNSLTVEPEPVKNRLAKILELIKMGDVSREHRDRFEAILDKYKHIILLEDEIPTPATVEKFKVFPKESAPVSSQSYRTPYAYRDEMRKILESNVQKGVLERHSSPWNSPTLLVKKPDGRLRLVVDFRKVNANVKSDSYPLPRIPDLLTNLKHSRYFTSFDCTSGFHQVPLDDDSKDILTIGNEFGQFRYNVMPMGFKNSPAHYQRVMDDLFRSIPQSELLVYIDDILVHSPTIESNLAGIEQTLELLASKNLQLKASKIQALVKSVTFCGQHIENGFISIPESRISAVRNQRSPRNKDEARSMFGFYNYLRNMIPNFAARSAAITATYRSGRFIWTPEAESSFRDLQQAVVSGTLSLAIPDTSKDIFVVETDASEHSMAGCLFMCCKTPEHTVEADFHDHDENCLRPVAFFSQNFKPSQMRQYIREKELRAFKTGLNLWRQYLIGREFIWRTDNRCNSYANQMKSSSEKVAKILAEVSEYTYKIQSRSSGQMKVSDFLSRSVNQVRMSRPDFAGLQSKDPVIGLVYNFTKINLWPHDKSDRRLSKEVQFWRKHRLDLKISDKGELVRVYGNRELLVVPACLRLELIESYHDSQYHPGIDNTMATLGKQYTWYGMRDQVSTYIRSCDFCQRTKPNKKPNRPPMAHTDTPREPFEKLSIDLTGPFQKTNRNNQWIVVINDHFSKRVYAKPIPNKEANSVLRVFKDVVYSNPCLPRLVLSDNGLEFAGVFQSWLSENGIKQIRGAPYHPATNGLTERSNQSLKARLMPKQNPRDWDLKIFPVVHAMNLTPNEVTKVSPFEIENGLVGKNPNSPVTLSTIPVEDLQKLRQSVYDLIQSEKRTRTGKYDRDFKPFSIGDEVLIKKKPSSNLGEKYFGPFMIESIFGQGRSYMVRNIEDKSQVFTRRIEEMKAYNRRDIINPVESPSSDDPVVDQVSNDDDWLLFYPNSGNGWPKLSSRKRLPVIGLLGSSPVAPAVASSPAPVVPPPVPVASSTVPVAPSPVPVISLPVPIITSSVPNTPASTMDAPSPAHEAPATPEVESPPTPVKSPEQMLPSYTMVENNPGIPIEYGPANEPEFDSFDSSTSSSDPDCRIVEVQQAPSPTTVKTEPVSPEENINQAEEAMSIVHATPERPNRKRTLSSPPDLSHPNKLPVIAQSGKFLSRAGLLEFINSNCESSHLKTVALHRVKSRIDLKMVAQVYKIPVNVRDPEDIRTYILKNNPRIRKINLDGVTWPIVQISSRSELVGCPGRPNFYSPDDQSYEQLLHLILKWKIPVKPADLVSKDQIIIRIESFSRSGKLRKTSIEGKSYFSLA